MKKAVLCLTGIIAALLLAVACGTDPFFHYITVISDGNVISHEVVSDGETFTFPDAPNGSRNFSHWVTDRSDDIYYPGDTLKITGDIVITAVMKTDPPSLNLPDRMSNLEKITLDSAEDTTYYYTLDGTDPLTSSTAKSGNEISLTGLTGDITITVVAVRGGVYSQPFTKTITVVDPPAKPTVTTSEDLTKPVSQSTVLTVPAAEGTTVRYTTDGSVPTSTTGTAVDGTGFDLTGLSGIVTIKIARFDSYGISSEVETLNLKVKPVTPTLTKADGTAVTDSTTGINDSHTLTIPEVAGAVVYYTTDGTEPGTSSTQGNSIRLEGLSGNRTIKAVAVKDDVSSDVMSVTVTVKPAPFRFNVEENTVLSQDGTLTANIASGMTLCYTLDGSDPKATGSSPKSSTDGKVDLNGTSGTVKVRAYAKDTGGTASDEVEFTVKVRPTAPVTTSIKDGTKYYKTGKVTGITVPSGSTLRYTLDGSEPTAESTAAADGIDLSTATPGDVTIKVVSEKDGVISSPAKEVKVEVCAYKLTYNLGGGTGTAPAEALFNTDDTITIASLDGLTKSGCTLDGWYAGDTYYAASSNAELKVTSDLTLTAKWIEGSFSFNEVTYTDSTGKAISGYEIKCTFTHPHSADAALQIPAVYHGKNVIGIANDGFSSCTNLAGVTFEKAENIKTIGENAFKGVSTLKTFTVPSGVETIGNSAFSGTAIESVTLPSTLKADGLGTEVFSGCTALKKVEFADGSRLTSIPDKTFSGAAALEEIKLPTTVTAVGESAFSGCVKITDIDLENIKTVGKTAFKGCTGITSLDLSKVETVGEEAFSGCTSLKNVSVGESVKTIGKDAFSSCTSITDVYIDQRETESPVASGKADWGISDPDNTIILWKKTYKMVFKSAEGETLKTIPFDTTDSITMIEVTKDGYMLDGWFKADGSFYAGDKESKSMTDETGDIVLKAKWIKGSFTFTKYYSEDKYVIGHGTSTGEEILIPSTYHGMPVASIDDGSNGFKDITTLKKVEFESPSKLEKIGGAAFSGCTGLTEFTIPDGVETIESDAFIFCENLTKVVLPDTITKLWNGVFYECTKLESINLSKVTYIDANVFYECTNLKNVDLSAAETIGNQAFYKCTSMTGITLSKAGAVGASAFFGCTGLTSVDLVNVKTIGESSFSGCTGITSIDLSKVEDIGKQAFNGCTGLTSATLTNVNNIGESAFNGCSNLKTVTVGTTSSASVSIGDNAFSGTSDDIKIEMVVKEAKVTTAKKAPWGAKAGSVTWKKESVIEYYALGESEPIGTQGFDKGDTLTIATPALAQFNMTLDYWYETDSSEIYAVGGQEMTMTSEAGTTIKLTAKTIEGVFSFTEVKNDAGTEVVGYGVSCGYGLNTNDRKNYTGKNGAITIPATYHKMPVVGIAANGFKNCSGIKSVTLHDSITSIGNSAFASSALESIEIPKSVTTIDNLAFEQCGSLSKVIFEDGCQLNSIAYSVFEGTTSLTSITLPSSIEKIDGYAFAKSGLTGIVIPDKVTTIGEQAFQNCTSLKTVSIGSGITTISDNSLNVGTYQNFDGCTALETIFINKASTSSDIPAGVDKKWGAPDTTKVYYSDSPRVIFDSNGGTDVATVYADESTRKVTEPTAPTKDGGYYFDGWYKEDGTTLFDFSKEVTGPVTVKAKWGAGYYSFTESGDDLLISCSDVSKISGDIVIPETCRGRKVVGIARYGFQNCTELEGVTFAKAENIVTIETYAFSGCSGLTSFNATGGGESQVNTIPSNVTTIGMHAFFGCKLTGEIVIPASVTALGSNAFERCTSLKKVSGAAKLAEGVFKDCSSLKSVEMTNVTSVPSNAFKDCSSLDTFETGTLTSVGDESFYGCSKLTSVDLSSVTTIGWSAFHGCSALTSVDLSSVTTIGMSAFYGCSKLTSVDLSKVTTIGTNAFYECTGLKSVKIGASITSIADDAFTSCSGLTIDIKKTSFEILDLDKSFNKWGATDVTVNGTDGTVN